jgi:hypothetical protein
MQNRIQHVCERFLSHSAFTKFFYKSDILLYLNQDFVSGEITLSLCKKDGEEHCGRLYFNSRGKFLGSEIISIGDLDHLTKVMDKLWNEKKYECMTISRSEFNSMFS